MSSFDLKVWISCEVKPLQQHPGGETTRGRCYRLTALCLLLLCVLLLTAIIVLWIKFNNHSKEKVKLETRYNTLTEESEKLQTRYNTLTEERETLQTRYNTLTEEKDQLQTRCNTLTEERETLQTRYNTQTKEKDQLQTRYNSLTEERERLQTRYNTLTKEKDQLQTRYNTQTKEKDQLQTRYNTLTEEREKLHSICKLGWACFSSSVYYISHDEMNWADSREYCKRKGADLMIINNKEEQEFIKTYLGNRHAWIGLSDTDAEGRWKWVDTTRLTTAYWQSGEPNNLGDEDCVEIFGNQLKKGWNDRQCSVKMLWICERLSGIN
ncbi:CD209 antigen-like protein C [Tachysurus vachellii]|uniref:CD209 antigen-like protein C n=1 Tax=Tachysurus vachellii TaxID=175792 RepID=UPI00296ABA83|nr:CD209 antigen-like protein C [Tachysurus vachellii]